MDDIRARIKFQRDLMYCSTLCFVETQLTKLFCLLITILLYRGDRKEGQQSLGNKEEEEPAV